MGKKKKMPRRKVKRKLLIVFITAVVAIGLSLVFQFVSNYFYGSLFDGAKVAVKRKVRKIAAGGREPWMTIFVHGSFGSVLGLLSAYNVMNDEVEGTRYKKVVSQMRRDPFFYLEQPILQKGLVRVIPTFSLLRTKSKKFAAYPFCKAYKRITDYVKPGQERNYFYTFGWSGLISQKRRRLEAIRFYNEVSAELEKYHKKEIYPKVRILTHSHGGNMVAYIGALDEALKCGYEIDEKSEIYKCDAGRERCAVLTGVNEKLRSLPKKSEVKRKKGNKRWDYRPEKRNFEVHELIMWGMPVQPETDHLFVSDIFKKVYHFYSDEDLVQRIDWVSTKQGYSEGRFDKKRLCSFSKGGKKCISQARIMVQRDLSKNSVREVKVKKPQKKSFWSTFFSQGSFVNPTSNDPSHKELWFFSWRKKDETERKFILTPFPVAVFSPLLVKLIDESFAGGYTSRGHGDRAEGTLSAFGDKKTKQNPVFCADFDINISEETENIALSGGAKRGNNFEFCLVDHGGQEKKTTFCVKKDFLEVMKKKIRPWWSKKVPSHNLLNLLGKHIGG